MIKKSPAIQTLIILAAIFSSVTACYAGDKPKWKALDEEAVLLYKNGDYDYALVTAKKALQEAENTLYRDKTPVAMIINNLATVYYALGLYDEAEPLYKRSLSIKEKNLGPNHLDVAQGYNNLATLYFAKKEYSKAEPLFRRAVEIREAVLGPDHPDTVRSIHNLGILYISQNTTDKGLAPSEAPEAPLMDIVSINVKELYNRINKARDIVILDIREKQAQQKKHIANSIRFPKHKLKNSKDELKAILKSTNRGATIAILSSGDEDSIKLAEKLRGSGYKAFSVDGGFSSWEEQGYPLNK